MGKDKGVEEGRQGGAQRPALKATEKTVQIAPSFLATPPNLPYIRGGKSRTGF